MEKVKKTLESPKEAIKLGFESQKIFISMHIMKQR